MNSFRSKDPFLLLVGGNGRNVGKTTLVCAILEHLVGNYPIGCLKISTVYPDDSGFHGNHFEPFQKFHLFRELSSSGDKDTHRMLSAGAKHVWYAQADKDGVKRAWEKVRRQMPERYPLICESGGLVDWVKPGLALAIRSDSRTKGISPYVDLLLDSPQVLREPHQIARRIIFHQELGWALGS